MPQPTRIVVLLGALCVSALAASGPLTAQTELEALDEWEREAQWQLFQYRQSLELEDLTHEVGLGSLDEGESTEFVFSVEGPGDYRALAVCDNDCTDVDLTLYDLDGSMIDQDIELDDFPYVDTGVLGSGVTQRFVVEVSMPACEVEPCRFAIAVFAR